METTQQFLSNIRFEQSSLERLITEKQVALVKTEATINNLDGAAGEMYRAQYNALYRAWHTLCRKDLEGEMRTELAESIRGTLGREKEFLIAKQRSIEKRLAQFDDYLVDTHTEENSPLQTDDPFITEIQQSTERVFQSYAKSNQVATQKTQQHLVTAKKNYHTLNGYLDRLMSKHDTLRSLLATQTVPAETFVESTIDHVQTIVPHKKHPYLVAGAVLVGMGVGYFCGVSNTTYKQELAPPKTQIVAEDNSDKQVTPLDVQQAYREEFRTMMNELIAASHETESLQIYQTEKTKLSIDEQTQTFLDAQEGDLAIAINKTTQELSLYKKEWELADSYTVSTGAGIEDKTKVGDMCTPEGVFHITSIEDSHEREFEGIKGAYGPWFLRLETPGFTGIGIHGTNEPEKLGNPVSHGCIRMQNEDVTKVKNLVEKDSPVLIYK